MKSIKEIEEWLNYENIPNHKPENRYVRIGTPGHYRSSIHETRGNHYRIYATDSDFQAVREYENIAHVAKSVIGSKAEIEDEISTNRDGAQVIFIENGNAILHPSSEKSIRHLICVYNDGMLIRVIRVLTDNYLKEDSGVEIAVRDKEIKDLEAIERKDVLEAIDRWERDDNIPSYLRDSTHTSRKYKLIYKDKEYNSKVIFVVAYHVHYAEWITTDDVYGGISQKTTVATLLHHLHFELTDMDDPVEAMDDSCSSEEIEEHASSLTMDTLARIASSRSTATPKDVETKTKTKVRDAYIAKYAKRRAAGHCQLCEQPAPFNRPDGEPYLESHHIIWLSEGGADSIENTVALCPNCHRKMHVVNDPDDKEWLQKHNMVR